MYQFESHQPKLAGAETESTQCLFNQLFTERSSLQNLVKAESTEVCAMEKARASSETIDSFGAIQHMNLPENFVQEVSPLVEFGALDQRVYHSTNDHDTIIVAAILHPPMGNPEGERKLKEILNLPQGPLNDAHRQEACGFLAKFGDNQYAPGNSLHGYGNEWTAPNYFVRNMEVREVSGKKMLTVDGAYTPAPWTPEVGIEGAARRFSAAFMLTPDGKIESVYLEAKSEQYRQEQTAFDVAIRNARFEK